MEKAKTTKDKYIRLSDLFFAVWDKIIILIIIGAVLTAGAFGLQYLKGQKISKEEASYLTYLELHMGPKANISSGTAYSELFLSDDTIQQVIKAENIDATVKQVRSYLYTEEREATLFRLVVLTPNKDLTEKIAKGMSTVGLSRVAGMVDSSQMNVVQLPKQPKPVKSDIPKVQTAYEAMSVKAFPATMVQDWETYYKNSTNIVGMVKKGLFAGVGGAGIVAIYYLVAAILKRKLRYPEDLEDASDLKVLVTVDNKLQGAATVAQKILDIIGEGRSILFLGGHIGDGVTTIARAVTEGISLAGFQATYLEGAEVTEDTIDATQGYVLVDGGSFDNSFSGVSISKKFDGTVLVVQEDSVDEAQINRMKWELIDAGANIMGIVLNKAKVDRLGRKGRYYGSYYGQGK